MRVCLLTPPSPYLLDDRALPWLGPLWVAACLRERGHDVSVLDLAGDPNYVLTAMTHAQTKTPDVYGITATSPDYHLAVQIRDAIRCVAPGVRLILGGAHATAAHAHCHGWDAIVTGDGFYAAERALTENGVISAAKKGEIVDDINTLPFPARDLIDVGSYDFRVLGERATSAMSQFGCSFNCNFCSMREVFAYRKVRMMAPTRILAELDEIAAHWPMFRAIAFFDDELNLVRKHTLELCEAFANHPRKWILRGFIKAELFTDEIAAAMSRAGFREVLTGVESGSDRILKRMRKNTSYAINGEARIVAKRHGIRFKAATMVGHPDETYEDAMLTKQWLLEFQPDEFDVTVLTPLPGSPIYDHPETDGRGLFFEKGDEILPYKTVPGEYAVRTRTQALSSNDLLALRDEIDQDVRQALWLRLPTRSAIYDASMGQLPVLSSL